MTKDFLLHLHIFSVKTSKLDNTIPVVLCICLSMEVRVKATSRDTRVFRRTSADYQFLSIKLKVSKYLS